MKKDAILIIDTSEENADLYYKTRFFVPDPVIYLEHDGEKILVLSDLEIDRGRKAATVDSVIPLSDLQRRLLAEKKRPKLIDAAALLLGDRKIKKVTVPGRFGLKYADELRNEGFKVAPALAEPLFMERLRKTPEEVRFIKDALVKTAQAMDAAVKMIAASEVRKNRLYLDGKPLTSERVKGEIDSFLSRAGFLAAHTIVACGIHSSMPHDSGHGPLFAGKPIVLDIFPRSQKTGYFGDMTRTVIKGEPTKGLLDMYDTVLKGQKLAIDMIGPGVAVKDVHKAVVDYFDSRGYKTGAVDGRTEGFIHSTGHGLGLEIHEPPRVGMGDEVLEEGNVVTVEPGLYYARTGGIRIEDVVVVEKKGCRNLTRYPKKFRL